MLFVQQKIIYPNYGILVIFLLYFFKFLAPLIILACKWLMGLDITLKLNSLIVHEKVGAFG